MGNSALSNLNAQEKKIFQVIKSKIDSATNYKKLKIRERTSPTLDQANVSDINFPAINKISSELKIKIKQKKRKNEE
jgi:hypothetical protein